MANDARLAAVITLRLATVDDSQTVSDLIYDAFSPIVGRWRDGKG